LSQAVAVAVQAVALMPLAAAVVAVVTTLLQAHQYLLLKQ
jgi:hypothetical protein